MSKIISLTKYKIDYLRKFKNRNSHLNIEPIRLYPVLEKTFMGLREPITKADFMNFYNGNYLDSSINNKKVLTKKELLTYMVSLSKDEKRKFIDGYGQWRNKQKLNALTKNEINLSKEEISHLKQDIIKLMALGGSYELEDIWHTFRQSSHFHLRITKEIFIEQYLYCLRDENIKDREKSKLKNVNDSESINYNISNEENQYELLIEELKDFLPEMPKKPIEPSLSDYGISFMDRLERYRIPLESWDILLVALNVSCLFVFIYFVQDGWLLPISYILFAICMNIIFDKSGNSEDIRTQYQEYINSRLKYKDEMDFYEINYAKAKKEYDEKSYFLSRKLHMFWLSLDPLSLEKNIAELFKKLGFKTRLTSRTNDNGIDIFISNNLENSIIQCKQYKSKIGVNYVRELYGALIAEGSDKAYLIGPNGFSEKAYDYSRGKNIILYDVDDIIKKVFSFRGYIPHFIASSHNLKRLKRNINNRVKRNRKAK